MDLINDFRDKNRILALSKLIKKEADILAQKTAKKLSIMEVCGGHTHTIMKYGLPSLVGENIKFIHGPGCPVCVMPRTKIDEAIKIASEPDTVFCTLADMLRVPGSKSSLMQIRANGADIRALYTPLDAIKIASENPQKRVVFFAIGFETTTPMSAVILKKAIELNLKNLFLHINHVTIPAPVNALMSSGAKIDAFLGPSHVSVITGSKIYKEIAEKWKTPIAVSGFEPLDVMASTLNIIRQKSSGKYEVFNEYSRVVSEAGNLQAQSLINWAFEPCDMLWRGLGEIKMSGMKLKEEFASFDAKKQFNCEVDPAKEASACVCGEILRGLKSPLECKIFGNKCTPKTPVGSCMVSSEGACAAYYKYGAFNKE